LPGVELPKSLQADAALLCDAVRQAGALGLQLLQQNVRNWAKKDGSVVTEADVQIDDFLKQRLHGERPHYGWLSEETPDDEQRLTCKQLWIVDPIDGTRAFVHGGDEWCVGAALAENGRPILAAIFRPLTNQFYFAAAGHGAFCNQVPLHPRDGETLVGAEIVGKDKVLSVLKGHGVVAKNVPNIPLLMRMVLIASGEADIALSFGNKNDWDLAAGDLMVQEAGGRVSTLDGQQMIYNKPQPWQNGMVAAGINRHGAVLAQLETL
jgi:myo-inositol-1(or 4)-monophosphatase